MALPLLDDGSPAEVIYTMNRMTRKALRRTLHCLIVASLTGCKGDDVGGPAPPPPTPPAPNFIRLQSDAGDYVGGGQSLEYTKATAIITVSVSSNVINVAVQGDQSWTGNFGLPAGVPVQAGTYTGATRYPVDGQAVPGLSWYGEGRGCNTLTGFFSIDSLTYTNGTLASVDLRFEQRCEGGIPGLRGTIHWRADDPTQPAGPVDPVPTNLWKPDPHFVPGSGTYALLASDPGDWIGAGEFRVHTAPASPMTVQSTGTRISVNVGGYSGEFVGMLGTIPLKVGYYGNLRRWPFHNPVRGGLNWSGNGRGCGMLTGWFAIDRIEYTGTTMTAVEMRFEQHCEGVAPALRGAIRWSQ